MKAKDLFEVEPYLKVLVYGLTGSGKTTWGARSPRPLHVLTERQGLASIYHTNPEAEVILIETYAMFMQLMDSLLDGTPSKDEDGQPIYTIFFQEEEYVFSTLVIDSLSDLHEKGKTSYQDGPGGNINWKFLQEEIGSVCDDLRSLPCNLITICLATEEFLDEGDTKVRRVGPMLYGKIKSKIGQWYSAVGYAARRTRANRTVHGIVWQGSDTYESKPAPGFPPFTTNEQVPGVTTLGSLLLHAYPGISVAYSKGDSAEIVGRQLEHSRRDEAEAREKAAEKPVRGWQRNAKKQEEKQQQEEQITEEVIEKEEDDGEVRRQEQAEPDDGERQ